MPDRGIDVAVIMPPKKKGPPAPSGPRLKGVGSGPGPEDDGMPADEGDEADVQGEVLGRRLASALTSGDGAAVYRAFKRLSDHCRAQDTGEGEMAPEGEDGGPPVGTSGPGAY